MAKESYSKGDYYNEKARKEGMPARSIYKLEELDQRFHLLAPGQKVVDLGAAPGSWSLYIAQKIGLSGQLFSYDIQPLRSAMPATVTFEIKDVLLAPIESFPQDVDLVLSDMAPSTTGDRFSDAARSHELSMRVLEIAQAILKSGHNCAFKVFEGEDTPSLIKYAREHFTSVKLLRPKATRSCSREIFVVGLGARREES